MGSDQRKKVRELVSLVSQQEGCEVIRTGGGKIQFFLNGDMVAHCGSTPSDSRAFANTQADLRRVGIATTKAELRKRKTDERKANDMRRDKTRVPEREKVRCPEGCTEPIGYVTDADPIERHMKREHNKLKCPACNKYFDKGGFDSHVRFGHSPEDFPPNPSVEVLEALTGPVRGALSTKSRSTYTIAPEPVALATIDPRGQQPTPVPKPEKPVEDERPTGITNPLAPTTRWVARYDQQAVTGKKYHLYRDCGQLPREQDGMETERVEGRDGPETHYHPEIKHIEVNEEMSGLLGLTCCRFCERKANKLTVQQVLENLLADACSPDVLSADGVLDALAEHGFKVVPS